MGATAGAGGPGTARDRRRSGEILVVLAVAVAIAAVPLFILVPPGAAPKGNVHPPGPFQHVVEIMLENHAFDNFFGQFPGADGPPNGTQLPNGSGGWVAPFWIAGNSTPDPPHTRAAQLADYDQGRMDGFVEQMALVDPSASNTPMGYYNATQLGGLWQLAHRFVLCEAYFASVLGPTVPNRLYAMAGSSAGVTSDLLPYGTELPTIFDQLSSYGLSWNYFYEPTALPSLPSELFPLAESSVKLANLEPLSALPSAIAAGALPAVTFVDPEDSPYSMHPPENVRVGEAWLLATVQAIEASPAWNSTVVFVTWDEGGGYYDHVAPPIVDGLGDGFRVPMIVVSPFSEAGRINTTVFDHTSVLHFLEAAWGLPFLTPRVAAANDLCSTLVLLPSAERCRAAPPLSPLATSHPTPGPVGPPTFHGLAAVGALTVPAAELDRAGSRRGRRPLTPNPRPPAD